MKTYTEILQELDSRKAELETVIMKSQGLIERLPEGKLRVSHCKGKPQYYKIVKPSDTCGKYINQKDLKTAKLLAQKDYLKSVIRAANDEITLIDRSNHATDAAAMITAESVYDHLKAERKLLVSPALMSNEEFARAWEQERYTQSDYEPDEKIYTTKRGETVRSKSEMLIADLYYELGIPYRYECKFKLHGGKAVYADSTFNYSEVSGLLEIQDLVYDMKCCVSNLEEYYYSQKEVTPAVVHELYLCSTDCLKVYAICQYEIDYLETGKDKDLVRDYLASFQMLCNKEEEYAWIEAFFGTSIPPGVDGDWYMHGYLEKYFEKPESSVTWEDIHEYVELYGN